MAIDPDVFVKNPILQATAPITDVFSDLNAVAIVDQQIAQKKAKFIKIAVIAFIGIFGVCIGFIVVDSTFIALPPIVLFLLVVGLIGLGVYAIFTAIRQSEIDIVDYRYLLLQRLFKTLSLDMTDNVNVKLCAEFSKPFLAHKKQTTLPHPIHQNYQIDLFSDRWLDLQGQFLDGNQFHLLVTEFYRKSYGRKRGRSGKSKYKEKYKSKGAEVALTLTYSQRKYGAIQVLRDEIQNAIQIPERTVLKRIRVSPKSIHLAVKVNPIDPKSPDDAVLQELYQTIMMMFLSLYQVLNLAKKLSEKQVLREN